MGHRAHQIAKVGRSDDWFTPRAIVEALGPFDLDPATSVRRPFDTADQHYSVELVDGLSFSWRGIVWLNPPYGRATEAWMRRLAEHGDGIALVFARTETRWFVETVWGAASAVLFVSQRVLFTRPDETSKREFGGGGGGGPSVLVAYGERARRRLKLSEIAGTFADSWLTRS